MADEQPIQNVPDEDSKKDTVRINLPQGGAAKPAGSPTPTVRLKPTVTAPGAAPVTDDESKKETAVMGTPIAAPKPKKDTSRVQVPAAKPGVPEMPRPTVKLKREEPTAAGTAPTAAPAAPVAAPAPRPAAEAAAPVMSGIDLGLAIAAMVVALVVAGYLFTLSGQG